MTSSTLTVSAELRTCGGNCRGLKYELRLDRYAMWSAHASGGEIVEQNKVSNFQSSETLIKKNCLIKIFTKKTGMMSTPVFFFCGAG